MKDRPRLLVVDDTPANIELFESMLAPRGFDVVGATSGAEALAVIEVDPPDLVVLDVVMPGMDGLQVCRQLRANPATRMLPVVLVTATAGEERVRALDAGADDFLAKPIDRAELLARVQSLLRVKGYHETIERQAAELAQWNRILQARVAEQVQELDRMNQLRRFLSPQVAELLISADGQNLLDTHRRQIAVASFRLSGFESLAESAAPELIMDILTEYHELLGQVFVQYEATVGPLVGDRVTAFLNDPLTVPRPAEQATRMAFEVRGRMATAVASWHKRTWKLELCAGVDAGYATLGTIAVAGKREYAAIGSVVHVAAALCEQRPTGRIVVSQRIAAELPDAAQLTSQGEVQLPGFVRPVATYILERFRDTPTGPLASHVDLGSGPLSEREREVVALIVRGLTNREIADSLIIAEGTAVRHVTNILNKLGLKSRAQIAVWALTHSRPISGGERDA